MPEFNGHKNWNHWNVSLWLNSDKTLYLKMWQLRRIYHLHHAAKIMLDYLKTFHGDKTPDGAPYSVSSVKAAMREI